MFDRSVQYFIKVVEKGSFSAAARELYLSQPALSKMVSQLEKNLGFPLFDRSGYRPSLTPEGRIYYEKVVKLTDEYNRTVQHLKKEKKRTYRIGFTGAMENRTLPRMLKNIREQDQIEFAFIKCTFNEQLEKLLSGDIDLAFGLESTFAGTNLIEYCPLSEYQMVVICSYDNRLASRKTVKPCDLEGQTIVALSPEFGRGYYRDFLEACRLDHMKCEVTVKDTYDELLLAVTLGEGIAIVSSDVVPDHGVHILQLEGSHHHNQYVLAWKSGSHGERFSRMLEKIRQLY